MIDPKPRPAANGLGRLALAVAASLAMAGCATQAPHHRLPSASAPSSPANAGVALLPMPPVVASAGPEARSARGVPYLIARPAGEQPGPADPGLRAARLGDDPSPAPPASAFAEVAADPAGQTPPSIPEATAPSPIDLPAALRLADNQNPTIGEARIAILGALAQRQAAYALLLPSLNAGGNYRDHVGVLQRSNGTILPVTLQSFYFGGGARANAAETVSIPAVNIFSPLTDAVYEPLAAQQRVRGARANAAASANDVLLDVARLYLELVGAEAAHEARRVTAGEADSIAADVIAFAATGQGRRSDADRAEADRRLLQTDILRAEELVAVTSAELSARLNLDPSSRLRAMNRNLDPIVLIDPDAPTEALIRTALAQRPDLETRRAAVAEAGYQVRKEKARPFLPTIWIGFSGGAFGGGSNIVPTELGRFAGRTDFDVRAYWTLLNFGAGNATLIKQRKAQAGQAAADEARVANEARRQVETARAQALALRNRVEAARARLRTAEDGYAQDRARLRETLARPIEALDSLRLLAEARVALIEAVTRHNQNQFALFVALGAPPPL